jgi:hypothetical protein
MRPKFTGRLTVESRATPRIDINEQRRMGRHNNAKEK